MSQYWYRAFGLLIRSELELPIPQCDPATARADLQIRLGPVDPTRSDQFPKGGSILRAGHDEICCQAEAAARILVRSRGAEMVVDPLPGTPLDVAATWVQGAGLSLMLHQRGYLVLHASAVSVDGVAICFVGDVGKGKSTTAAAVSERGNPLLCDDLAAARATPDGKATCIRPGIPHLKLTSQSLEFLHEDAAAHTLVAGDEEKRVRLSRKTISSEPIELAAIYILDWADQMTIEPLSQQTAMIEMMRHAFVARHSGFLRVTGTDQAHFKNCTDVVKAAAVCWLKRPRSFEQLLQVAQMVEQHARRLAQMKPSSRPGAR
jgi:hypothetical protein